MSVNSNSTSQLLLLDHEPTDSTPDNRPGSVSAEAPIDIEAVLEEIMESMNSGSLVRSLTLMEWLLRSDSPMSVKACLIFAEGFRRLVPDCPKPIISALAVEFQSLLEEIVALGKRLNSGQVQAATETLCYRMYEARGEFAKARTLIAVMRDRADRSTKNFSFTQLTNNYGYEYLLEADFSKARPYFIEAVKLFEKLENVIEVANAQANLLTCEFALCPDSDWEVLLPTLTRTHALLFEAEDWRVRKTMLLLAKRAQAQGRVLVAVAWARRAVNASRYQTTQLQQDDKRYVDDLLRKASTRSRPGRLVKAARTDQFQRDNT